MERITFTELAQALGVVVALIGLWIAIDKRAAIRSFLMSTFFGSAGAIDSPTVPVHVPVQANRYSAGGTENKGRHDNLYSADTDAESTGTDWQPRLPRYPTEEELVIYLATVRDRRGKYLRSANKIAEFSELHRNEVLKLVREVREGVPEYPPMPPGGEETRRELALD